MRLDLILRVMSKLLLPFMVVFALYVQFHADFGPGGGFQAGVIAAGAVILYSLVFGLPAALEAVPAWVPRLMVPLGALIYAGTGVAGWLLGGQYLQFSYFAAERAYGHHIGILVVEFGVLVTVVGAMLAIYYAIAERSLS